ncbi:BZ3500_MvSof-1268-A1-R1_Chr2-2g05074 [Microbotryum saponariae]|uniref:Peptide-methionine (R)-S-oxide reductase n=1 Tax=Microbotryum saponariae TaxID=289078 RepID=A0A2X0K8N2_9BASI|nr:BZ3500_MvSof-1268-A1-R1_Chr2-2g05074 [Microbotryum saponariae]SDA00848.1 BZ3501_MvSof-1269-A2-R1_Chr2-2g04748 [Microbotryum saponariae]
MLSRRLLSSSLRSRPRQLLLLSTVTPALALSYYYATRHPSTTSSFTKLGNAFSTSSRMAKDQPTPESYPKAGTGTHSIPAPDALKRADAELTRSRSCSEQFRILRKKGTEMAGSGELDKHFADKGVYECAGCGTPLYTADTKFKSGCGWPAFFDAIPGAVTRFTDKSWGMERTEIVCSSCGGHLGHIFKGEGFNTPTDERACVNSVSIRFNDKIEGTYKDPPKI